MRRIGVWIFLLAAVAAATPLLAGHADRFIPAISEWYLDVASPHAVKPRSDLVRGQREDTPFEACARRAARESGRDGTGTIITFDAEAESIVTTLHEKLVIILSRFEERFENGGLETSEFGCAVRWVDGEWRVESMTVSRRQAILSPSHSAVARGTLTRGATAVSDGVKSSPGLTKRSDSQAYWRSWSSR